MSTAEKIDQDGRTAAYDLIRRALETGQPLSLDVRTALSAVLNVLSLSDHSRWMDAAPDATPEQQEESIRWHAAGWHSAVGNYRSLLAVVRESGVSGTREGVST